MNLHFEVVGEGRPVVILHGLLGSADNWRSMSRRLGAYYQVFAVDLRNHGRSPHSNILDYDVMAADVREFMEQQPLRRIILLGHSMGGKVAMQFAIEYSEQVHRLIVVDIAPKAYEPSQRYLLQALRSLDLSRYKSFTDVDAALAPERNFNKPTLFIRGGRSNYIEDTDDPLIRQMFPEAEIATLPDAGHWAHVDAPEEFFQTVLNFLNRT